MRPLPPPFQVKARRRTIISRWYFKYSTRICLRFRTRGSLSTRAIIMTPKVVHPGMLIGADSAPHGRWLLFQVVTTRMPAWSDSSLTSEYPRFSSLASIPDISHHLLLVDSVEGISMTTMRSCSFSVSISLWADA